jgi:toxin ParE1/3/4
VANKGFELSRAARLDLFEIADYIAADNPVAAQKLIDEIEKACERLAAMPTVGHRRKDLTPDPDVRFYCVRDYYLVIYRKGTKPLQIARVLHSARDIEEELRED